MEMDLTLLRVHEDAVVKVLEPMSRIRQLIALRYLRNLLEISIEDTGHEIMKEYRKELTK